MRPAEIVADRFEIEREVASGGMGRVYLARDRLEGRAVAVKVVLDPQHDDVERFRREASLLAEIHHPGIVRYVSHGTTPDDEPYLVMEWLDGEDLAARLRPGPLRLREALIVAQKTGEALGELHRRGLVHRDVKPSNVFLEGGSVETPKLLDFGVARAANVVTVTRTGMLVGTPTYMAPEQARGARDVDARADVWALGCILFESLVGAPPFSGLHAMAVLAKILLDDAPRLRDVLTDAPPVLDGLLARLLAKEPDRRPADGAEVAAEIAEMLAHLGDLPSGVQPRSPLPASRQMPSSISAAERRVHCIVVTGSTRQSADATVISGVDGSILEDVHRVVDAHGGRLEPLRDGSLLIALSGARTATDQATRAARVALAIRSIVADVPFVVTTGRGEGPTPVPVGALIDRAVAALAKTEPGKIRVDPATADLLDARFVVERSADFASLESERDGDDGARVLLGKRTSIVGRDRELRVLEGIFDECVEEPVARAVLVTATAGAGKSRLRSEIVRRLRAREPQAEILFGQGDSLSAGSPFVMIAPALRRSAGILDGEPIEARREKLAARVARTVKEKDRARVTEFLGELCNVPMVSESESLRAARKDPMLMGDAMRSAFEDFLAAELAAHPVVIVLEDLHWGDVPSVRFVDAVLRTSKEAPLMVLALARPEIHTQFPDLWSERALQEIRLDALGKKAAERLVREVLDQPSDETVAMIVERAAGNAFFLEELIRAVASGDGSDGKALPDTVLATLQARLDALGPEAKRVLRAGSVFGEVFWRGGVRSLLGGERTAGANEWLDELVAREVIGKNANARIPGETEYAFRHALVRDAAYEMLTDEDRVLAHRLAGEWLASVGGEESDALVLAEHFARGDSPAQAATWYRRAAEQALEGNDLAAVLDRAEKALVSEENRESRGALRLLQAVASYWRSQYTEGQAHAIEAAELLAEGSAPWFRATAEAMVSSARRGDYPNVDRFVEIARRATAKPGAESAQIVALCRGTFQLIFAGRFDAADALLAEVTMRAGNLASIDPATTAQVHHVRGVRHAHGGRVGQFLLELEAAVASFAHAGDTRNVALETPTVGWCWAELGEYERAEAIVRDAVERCERLGVLQTKTYAQVNLGYVLSYRGAHQDAERVLLDAAESCRKASNPRLEGWALSHLAHDLRMRGELDRSIEMAIRAESLLAVSPGLRAWSRALLADALIAAGRADEALPHATRAMDDLVRLGSMLQGETFPPLVLAEARHALGDREGAERAILDARQRLNARAEALPDERWRASFLRIPENSRTLELASAWA
ncbi:MAG: serine/threonine-protein kinase [Polyangiales bacterium]